MKKKIRCPYFELNDLERAYHDAQCFIALRRECGTFSKWLWAFTDGKTLFNPDNAKSDEWTAPARTELSDRIAAELKSRGFKFLGSVTVYAFMQSVGLVNDHARFCFRYKELRNDSPAMIPLALRREIWFNMPNLAN